MATIGFGTGIGGPIDTGISQKMAADYQAQVASNNAIIAKQNAQYAASAGAAQAEEAGLKARAQAAGVRASEAANGVEVNGGSAAEVQDSQRLIGDLNQQTVSNNAALETYGYESQATSFKAQSELQKFEGTYDLVAGFTNAATAAVGGSPNLPQNLGTSQLSGNPSVPQPYQWMQNDGGYDDGQ